ncbi:recombinase family protein [Frankia sp. AgB1.9]|uniref:recombinase family protein n=1 Tax=unclassified Frankia TaxID=2632575 RepID=UPI001933C968|nr:MULTISPECIES: recombinase family protein [unclassified Frankia]MBL7548655.1 recombinase family protein [Frankia sp. AgB1.9]
MVTSRNGAVRPAAVAPPVAMSPLGAVPSFEGVRFGLYTRISDDADDDAKGVARQEADERAWVTSVGGVVCEPIYEENDTSAYKKKRIVQPDGSWVYRVIRPVWQRMLADLRAGVIDAVIVADLDRLARDPRDLEDAIEIVEHHRRPIVGLTGGFDLLTDGGKFTARILVAMANKSSADTARRVRRWHLDMQQTGKITGGPRPFGWNDDRRTLHPIESEILTKCVGRLLDGVPLTAIVTEWNRDGITGTRGKAWQLTQAKQMLRNPRLCGWRGRTVYETDPETGEQCTFVEVVHGPDGTPVIGEWEPILTPEKWERVVAVIGARPDGKRSRGQNARKYLLTGIVRCGECNRPMMGTASPYGHHYLCPASTYGCGKVARNGPKTDKYITAALINKVELELADAPPAVDEAWPKEAELADVRTRIEELNAAYRAKQISGDRYFPQIKHFEDEERGLLANRARHTARVETVKAAPANIRAEWDSYTLPHRRAIIEDYLHAVIVAKSPRRGAPFDPDLLDPQWK